MRRRLLAALCSAWLVVSRLSPEGVACAQTSAAAEELYRRGVADFQAGRYDVACKELGDSYRMEELAGVLFTWATCEARAGRVASASAHYRDFLEFVAKSNPQQRLAQQERAEVADRERKALLPDIPYITLIADEPLPPGTVVSLDGAALGESSLGQEMPIDPGAHTLGVRLPDGRHRDSTVRIAKAQHLSVELELPEPLPPPAEPPRTAAQRDLTALKWVAGGVGVAGVAVGTVAGILAIQQKSIVDDQCQGSACSPDGLVAVDSGKSAALTSTIGFGVGAAGVVGLVVLLVVDDDDPNGAAFGSPWGERWTVAGNGITMTKEF